MKFTASSTDLTRSLSKVINVVPTKSTLPILENLLLELEGNSLRITAADHDVSVSLTTVVSGMEDGRTAISGRRFFEMVRSLPQNVDLVLTADPGTQRVTIVTGQGEYLMASENPLLFPEPDQVDQQFSLTFDVKAFETIIQKSIFAVATEDTRLSMTGVLFQWKMSEFRAVATDGHRLVLIKHPGLMGEAELEEAREVIMPAKSLSMLLKSMEEGEISVSFGRTNIMFTYGSTRLFSKIIDERFPNYETVIPIDNNKCLTVNRAALLAAVRRCSIFSNHTNRQVRLSVENETLTVSSEDIETGNHARESMPCTFTEDGLFEIGFNARYIEDSLARIDTEEISFFFSNPTRGGIIKPVTDVKDMDLLMLVMPLRLNS